MDRLIFERLRDLTGKEIRGDIRFVSREALRPFLTAEIAIENDENYGLRLSMRFNTDDYSKTFNVHAPGVGPICRLDVDGHNHPPSGRQHKHGVVTDRCTDNNLPTANPRPDLAGKSMRECFVEFCRMAQIHHVGQFFAPDEGI